MVRVTYPDGSTLESDLTPANIAKMVAFGYKVETIDAPAEPVESVQPETPAAEEPAA